MTKDEKLATILAAPRVTQELADNVGYGIEWIYKLRRRHGAHVDVRFKDEAERILRYKVSEKGCWEWTGATGNGGYGRLYPFRGEVSAHRASYVFHKGRIPEGMLVLHSCDNRLCINPDHLRVGDHSDNNRDAFARERRVVLRGETNPNAKLTEEQVIAIRLDNRSNVDLAREFGVSETLISAVRHRKAWRTMNATARAQMNLR